MVVSSVSFNGKDVAFAVQRTPCQAPCARSGHVPEFGLAVVLYSVIRIIEGLITIALQVRPLGSLRVISLHQPMFERRTFRVLEFLAFPLWLNMVVSFFGLLTPLISTIEAVLRTSLAIGSLKISLGQVMVTVWASFLSSKFMRFLLEEDVCSHLHLGRGIPQAISTIIHYAACS
jgi:potassium efflux system protein